MITSWKNPVVPWPWCFVRLQQHSMENTHLSFHFQRKQWYPAYSNPLALTQFGHPKHPGSNRFGPSNSIYTRSQQETWSRHLSQCLNMLGNVDQGCGNQKSNGASNKAVVFFSINYSALVFLLKAICCLKEWNIESTKASNDPLVRKHQGQWGTHLTYTCCCLNTRAPWLAFPNQGIIEATNNIINPQIDFNFAGLFSICKRQLFIQGRISTQIQRGSISNS